MTRSGKVDVTSNTAVTPFPEESGVIVSRAESDQTVPLQMKKSAEKQSSYFRFFGVMFL
jgi:hypothetical protein